MATRKSDRAEATYIAADGEAVSATFDRIDPVGPVRGQPVRDVRSRAGQRNYSGLFWSATTQDHLGYESLLDTGLARWPSHSFAINTAWVTAVALAIDLLCWMRLLLLDGPLAKAEPATLRYRLLHAAARLVKRSHYLILRDPETWPWAQEFAAAVNRVRAIP